MKAITVSNYKEFKPSEFIRSFKSDLESVFDNVQPNYNRYQNFALKDKYGRYMDLKRFTACFDCLGCLGSIALTHGFGIDPDYIGDLCPNHQPNQKDYVYYHTMRLGDSIRKGDLDCIEIDLRYLFGKDWFIKKFKTTPICSTIIVQGKPRMIHEYNGVVSKRVYYGLLHQIDLIADAVAEREA